VEAGPNEAEYFDLFIDLDDMLGQYSNDNRAKAESDKKSILGEVVKEADIEIESDDDLEHEEENFKVNDDSDGFLDKKSMTEDVVVDI
nr:hypothetical protein [Tanacetum cinerariifolium]